MVRRSKKIGRANIALGHCDRKKKKYEELKILCAGIASEKLLLTGTGLRIARTNRVLIGSGDIKDTTDSGSHLTTSQIYTIKLTPGHG